MDVPRWTKTIKRHLNNEEIKNLSSKVNYEAQIETIELCSSLYNHECLRMTKSDFLGRKEIQFRRSKWLSEVLLRKRCSRRELLIKGIVEENFLWSGEASHLQENLNYNLWVIDTKQQIMWRC